MKVLFVFRHSGYLRNFEWILRELAARGHRVQIGFLMDQSDNELAERLAETYAGFSWGYAPELTGAWAKITLKLRNSVDYLRYVTPLYRDATALRARFAKEVSKPIVVTSGLPGCSRPASRLLGWLERNLPIDSGIDSWLSEHEPDVVIVTPLVSCHSQTDYVRSARARGLPTVLAVASWDNLTNKGLIHEVPDRIYVWNEAQRREAIELHGVPAAQVIAVGAHSYDHWFAWTPSTSRDEFCAKCGLESNTPFVVFVCSSPFVARDESPFVDRWIDVLRGKPSLADVGILVRPHPQVGEAWAGSRLGDRRNVTIWPAAGADPNDRALRQDYYDSLHHSAAVVGINTSALIEAAIVGRRTYTVLLPELRPVQEGTLHFHYLLARNGGPLVTADSLDEHAGQLSDALYGEEGPGWNRQFLESFIRPHGLQEAGAPRFVDDLEQLRETFAPSFVPKRTTRSSHAAVISLDVYRRAGVAIRNMRRRLRKQRKQFVIVGRRLRKRTRSSVRRLRGAVALRLGRT
jgi:hypothetical protein